MAVAALAASALLVALSPFELKGATYQVDYFSGLRAPKGTGHDAVISILDTGQNGSGSLCADIYVLSPSKEMEACCGCKMTPNELRSGSVVKDLLSNNLTKLILHAGVIKIISSAPTAGECDPATPATAGALVAWMTRIDSTGGTKPKTGVTTAPFASATLSTSEENWLSTHCGKIIEAGSGFGVCICPVEPPN